MLPLNGATLGVPLISCFIPGNAPAGAEIAVIGAGFSQTSVVMFGNLCAEFYVVNSTMIRAVVPIGATTGVIKVYTPRGRAYSITSFYVKP